MHQFESRYCFASLGRAGRIMAVAAAHHRRNFIHPFPDGNGRVSRLMSHAMEYPPVLARMDFGRCHAA
jgi:Fic family protein